MVFLPSTQMARLRAGLLIFALVAMAVWGCGRSVATKVSYQPQEGDILFQSLPDPPGLDIVEAIEGATESPYSHCGVVVQVKGDWFVLEAMVPRVRETPLDLWLKRGQGKYDVYRLKEKHRKRIPHWIFAMRTRMGKRYDFRYQMDDEAIYCSELPFDAWKEISGEEMGKIVKLGDLKWQKFRSVIEEIEGTGVIPVERELITPRDLAAAEQLELVVANGFK